ncbi:MAG: hypothetical protein PHC42_00870 [Bacilli bacterium]|nr:hypothetical protein [Bacilli bacterium]
MKNKYSINDDLFTIGIINALTGYYEMYASKTTNNYENICYLNSGIILKSSILYFNRDEYVEHLEKFKVPNSSKKNRSNFMIKPKTEEIIRVQIYDVKSDRKVLIEKQFEEERYGKLLKEGLSYEYIKNLITDVLNNKDTFFDTKIKDKEYDYNDDQKKDIKLKSMNLMRWLDFKIREEKDVKILQKND